MSVFPVYPLFDIAPVRGKGCYVYDNENQSYLDFYGGHAVISIGHAHPHYIRTISYQLEQLAFYSNSIQNPLQQQLAQQLENLSGCADYQLFLCNSGAEANENALKLASFQRPGRRVLAFEGAFHGRTSAAVNVTDNLRIKAPINTGFPVDFLPWNDLDAVAGALQQDDVCALIIESIQGIGGVRVAEATFLQEVARLCKQREVILILDEIQAGYGRSGRFFGFQHADIEPDLITMAKGMGNGFPIGGVLIHPRFRATHGMLGTTFGGNHLACAAGIAVLDMVQQESLMQNAAHWGAHLRTVLRQLPGVKEVRGMGLMLGVVFDYPIADLRKQLLYEEHIFTGAAAQAEVLRLLPPLTIGEEEVTKLIKGLQSVTSNTNA